MHKNNKYKLHHYSALLNWAVDNFPVVCFLNSNSLVNKSIKRKNQIKGCDWILAAGFQNQLLPAPSGNFERLKNFRTKNKKQIFGFLNYDLKNEIENLSSHNFDGIEMPLLHFFVPEYVFVFKNGKLKVYTDDKKFNIEKINTTSNVQVPASGFQLLPRFSKKQYLQTVNKIKKHIQRGDIYEINFCKEFFAENAKINPVETYLKLNEISPMPFSCFYKLRNKYLLCSSPERFLKKEGNKIISQPIKGTIRRGKNNKEDKLFMKELFENKKEQSENVMIVDLVRNDLSRIAKPGTVNVDELFGIYSYKHLHQMISTVSCRLDKKFHFVDAIKNAFPMGSMTGAPKVKAMELIEKYESAKRGLFSGAVGHITANGDFDFNVVIRSIFYNAAKKYVSVMAGSAITANSKAENEYEECLLKAEPMFKAINAIQPRKGSEPFRG